MSVKHGDTVLVHYTGRLDNGKEFDSSRDSDPLEFTIGEGHVIAGFEKAVTGLKKGEKITVRLEPQDAYGSRDKNLFISVPLQEIPEEITPVLGDQLLLQTDHGPMEVTISKITDKEVILDANHPLCDQALTFDIELIDILDGPTRPSSCNPTACSSCGCNCGDTN